MKAMQASLHGIPIVAPTWITACLEKKAVAVPDSNLYVRTLPSKTGAPSNFGVAYLAAAMGHIKAHRNNSTNSIAYNPFQNVIVYLCGFSNKNVTAFAQLLREAGARQVIFQKQVALAKLKGLSNDHVEDEPDKSCRFVILCNDANVSFSGPMEREIKIRSDRVLVVNVNWLFDSVSCGCALGSGPYKPHGGKAQDLWALSKSVPMIT
jgi:hypothetical protein